MTKQRIQLFLYGNAVSHEISVSQTEDVACDLCGGRGYDTMMFEAGYEVRQCTGCSLAYLNPQPVEAEMSAINDGHYPPGQEEDYLSRSLGYVENQIRGIILAKNPQGGVLLDVGCGFGDFLLAMEGTHWQRRGIDMSPRAIQFAKGRLGDVPVELGDFEQAGIAPGSLDCIVMISTLEHVKSPKAILARVFEALAPGGLCVFQVPYLIPFFKLKRFIPFIPILFEAPRHLHAFSPRTLTRYLEDAGLVETHIEPSMPYASGSLLGRALIWGTKAPGFVLYALTGRRYIYPFVGGVVSYASKPA